MSYTEKSVIIGDGHFADNVMRTSKSDSSGASGTTYKYTLKKGIQAGIGASSSGLGAKAHVQGYMNFKLVHLDSNSTFRELKTKYNFSAGTGGFFGWLVGSAHGSTEKQEINRLMSSLSNEQAIQGTVQINLDAESPMINVQVDCAGYMQYLEITDNQGNKMNVFSSSDAKSDTGAVGTNSGVQPTVSDNKSEYGQMPT